LDHCSKKLKHEGSPNWKVIWRVPPLWPTYIGERRTTFAKAYGIKLWCYWELFALNPSHAPTQKKLAWKVDCPLSKWNVNSGQSTPNSKHNWKKKTPPPNHPPERKRGRPLYYMTRFLIGCMEIQFLKQAATIFGLDG
jgi:hypothetical protein